MDMLYSIYQKDYYQEINDLPATLIARVRSGCKKELDLMVEALENASHGEYEYFIVEED
jgi:hypothetical protein